MPPVGFEPTISADERPQTYALDHAATGTGIYMYVYIYIYTYIYMYIYVYIYIYMEHPFLMFLDHTQRRSTVGRTPLDE